MTQTPQGPKTQSQQLGRPGQRQQERLARLERRRRRRMTWTIVAVVVVLLFVVGGYFLITLVRSNAAASTASSGTPTVSTPAGSTPAATATTPPLVPSPGTANAPATPPPTDVKAVTLPDGLQYIDLKTGSGPAAKTGSAVSVQYTGWLQSTQQKFDSSYDHGGTPFTVTLGQHQVISGWEEGLVGIKAGGKRRLIIPPALGYGATAQGPIPANSTLVFDVEAVSVK